MGTAPRKKKTSDPFSREADTPREDEVKLSDLKGRLVIVERTDDAREIETKYGTKEAVPARVLDVDSGTSFWSEVLVFNAAVVSRLKATSGPIAGTVDEVPSGKGNPALIIRDAEPDSDDHARALEAWEKVQVPF